MMTNRIKRAPFRAAPFRTARFRAATLAGLLALTLAGCSRSADEEATPADNAIADNYQAEAAPEPLPDVAPTAEPLPPAELNATAAEALPPETVPSQDEQMADDASATGMTARASRDQPADEPATDGNFSDR